MTRAKRTPEQEEADEASARRAFTQPMNPDPVSALAKTPPPAFANPEAAAMPPSDVSRETPPDLVGTITETTPAAVVDVPEVTLTPADPLVEACPQCGLAERMTLPEGWQEAVTLGGAHIRTIGCGAPWHYVGLDA